MSQNRFEEQTYYQILEIPPDAAQHEIHQAYERAKRAYSTDSPALYTMFSPQEAKELIALIEEAYNILSSQPRRQEYDLKLMRNRAQADLAAMKTPAPSPAAMPTQTPVPSNENIPQGFAKTRFGVYEIDAALEQEMKAPPDEIDGNFLQRIRLYKRIPMEQLAEHTKISKSYWCAIEANDHKALPAAVFVRGFVAQMARLLGMNDRLIADAYMKHYKKTHVD